MPGDKRFRDPVHGYITIPVEYCVKFIDTELFQRLRRIEQTSMRVLFPAAHHDRFAHSLGVYHLGKIAFDNLVKNSDASFNLEQYRKTLEIACLLHDCAHAPFSHTTEKYFVHQQVDPVRKKLTDIIDISEDPDFNEDFKNTSPGEHELVSSILALSYYRVGLKEIGALPHLVARMITGCTYSKNHRIENCLIELVNSKSIDVDKLDYIIRDTWASGVSNVRIDETRLLSALMIREDQDHVVKLFYKKHALSVINSVIEGRNFLFEWVYGHHKVNYETYLIEKSLEEISKLLSKGKTNFLKELFSLDTFFKIVRINKYSFYLPCDGDIYYLFKSFKDKIPEIQELLSRQYSVKALWKSKAGFKHFFEDIGNSGLENIFSKAENALNNYFIENNISKKCIIREIKSKRHYISPGSLFIDIDGEIASYTSIMPHSDFNSIESLFFYIYVPLEAVSKRRAIRELLRSLK